MPLDIDRDQRLWNWLRIDGQSFQAGPDALFTEKVQFQDIVALGEFWRLSEDAWPGLYNIVVLRNRIGRIPDDAIGRSDLFAALEAYWGTKLPNHGEDWETCNLKRGVDSRIVWPQEYKGSPVFLIQSTKEVSSNGSGVFSRLADFLWGPDDAVTVSLSPQIETLLNAAEASQRTKGDSRVPAPSGLSG